jgi:NADPH:quinone reductase-like Zn-dependent oxidoreductase
VSIAGTVAEIGPGEEKFKKGDRVLSCTATILRKGDTRYGGFQKFVLSEAHMTSRIGDTPFVAAVTASSTLGNVISALVLHLGLERPAPGADKKEEKILIWGGASSVGGFAIQAAAQVFISSPLAAMLLQHREEIGSGIVYCGGGA